MVVLMGDEERGLAFLFCERIVRWVNTDRIVSIAYSFSSKWSLTLYFLLSVAIGGFTSPLSSLYLNKLVLFLQLLDRFEFFGMSDGFMMMMILQLGLSCCGLSEKGSANKRPRCH